MIFEKITDFIGYLYKKGFIVGVTIAYRAEYLLQLTVLPNLYKFPLTELPENESYSGYGDDHTSNFS